MIPFAVNSQQALTIRELERADIARLQSWLAPDDRLTADQLHQRANSADYLLRVLVVKDAHAMVDRTVGYYLAQQVLDECHLHNIAIAPDFQRRGFARQLLQDLGQQAVARQCREILLEVRASNTAAIALYEHSGFRYQGSRPGYYPARGTDSTTAQPATVTIANTAAAREDALLYCREYSI